MRKMSLVLSLFLLSISLLGCQQNSEVKADNLQINTEILEKITIYPLGNNAETLIIEDTETIESETGLTDRWMLCLL